MDTSQNIGIGFFGTLTNRTSSDNVGVSGGLATVKNINLDKINVSNTLTETASSETVVSGVLDLLGGLLGAVGGLLDGIIGGLGTILEWITGTGGNIFEGISLKSLLKDLFDIRGKSPDNFATGGFAGRIIGEVEVSGCQVTNLTVSNVMDMTGGFVGNVEGLTEYEGLSDALGTVVKTLSGILNLIPVLALAT